MPFEIWIHNKTGEEYYLVLPLHTVLNCTNERDGEEMILYSSPKTDLLFVREKTEFLEKFTKK